MLADDTKKKTVVGKSTRSKWPKKQIIQNANDLCNKQ